MATESFTGADDTLLATHNSDWSGSTQSVGNLELFSNRTRHTGAWQTSAARNTASTEAKSEIVLVGGKSSEKRNVAIYMGASTLGYSLLLTTISGSNYTQPLIYENGGWIASLDSGTWATASDHTLRIEISGTTIEGFVDDVSVGTTTDSTITSGNPGFWCGEEEVADEAAVDDWSDLAGGAGLILPQGLHGLENGFSGQRSQRLNGELQ